MLRSVDQLCKKNTPTSSLPRTSSRPTTSPTQCQTFFEENFENPANSGKGLIMNRDTRYFDTKNYWLGLSIYKYFSYLKVENGKLCGRNIGCCKNQLQGNKYAAFFNSRTLDVRKFNQITATFNVSRSGEKFLSQILGSIEFSNCLKGDTEKIDRFEFWIIEDDRRFRMLTSLSGDLRFTEKAVEVTARLTPRTKNLQVRAVFFNTWKDEVWCLDNIFVCGENV